MLEAFEEHGLVDQIVTGLEGTPFDAEEWQAKFKTLKDNVEHHIEEEEGEMFPKARQVFDQDELADLGARMAELKESATQEEPLEA